jgi:glycosyltransferase involved in cell wall biosynthesis
VTGQARPRLCIFVIAYHAETTLRRVLDRIPEAIFQDYDCEILVVDDASGDRTFNIGHEYRREHPQIRMTVLRNAYNQGYGGNQKIGYSYAIAEGFDFVAMVHGDGQYAPEHLPRLLAPLRDGQADAVFGSRMLVSGAARKGGMPLYKWLGNRILTASQNVLLGTRLSEFHSGYRIYATRALRDIRYRLNSNDFHFDTEIIIQLLNAGKRIQELPIPTYYGEEICRVNGMKYAGNVMLATLRNWFHRAGLLYQRRFDPANDGNQHYGLKLGYPSSHTWAIDAVPDHARVIDLGAGPGGVASQLVGKGCEVAVVDRHPPTSPPECLIVHAQDLDEQLRFDVKPYDYILMLDIVEHLRDPEDFMARLRRQFDHKSRHLVLTTPNVAFIVQRLMLFAGQFNYGKAGILDRTHTRLFTFRGVRYLLRDTGFRIRTLRGIPAPFPKVVGNGWLGRALIGLNQFLIRISKSLFAYQIYIEADSTPDEEFVLANTRQVSAEQAAALDSRGRQAGGS